MCKRLGEWYLGRGFPSAQLCQPLYTFILCFFTKLWTPNVWQCSPPQCPHIGYRHHKTTFKISAKEKRHSGNVRQWNVNVMCTKNRGRSKWGWRVVEGWQFQDRWTHSDSVLLGSGFPHGYCKGTVFSLFFYQSLSSVRIVSHIDQSAHSHSLPITNHHSTGNFSKFSTPHTW